MTMKKQEDSQESAMSFEYRVPGDPPSHTKVNDSEPSFWTAYKQAKFNYIQNLKNQQDCRQLVDGSISLEVTFFVKPTICKKVDPSMFSLFNFLHQAIHGTICKKNCTISSVQLKKIYDKKPRTEIKIIRLQ